MIAVIGVPGSRHHRYKRFGPREKAQAREWMSAQLAELAARHPAASQPTYLLTERVARKIRYQDGTRVYQSAAERGDLHAR